MPIPQSSDNAIRSIGSQSSIRKNCQQEEELDGARTGLSGTSILFEWHGRSRFSDLMCCSVLYFFKRSFEQMRSVFNAPRIWQQKNRGCQLAMGVKQE